MTEDFPQQGSGNETQEAIEAAVFRRLLQHLDSRKDVQNIDLMNLAGFCRNCLSKWYAEASSETGVELHKEAAREIIYGMPYARMESALSNRGYARADRCFCCTAESFRWGVRAAHPQVTRRQRTSH